MQTVGSIIIGILVAALVAAAFLYGTAQSDRNDCTTWQKEAKLYPGFYLTQWQKQQCDYYKITVDAPVIGPAATK